MYILVCIQLWRNVFADRIPRTYGITYIRIRDRPPKERTTFNTILTSDPETRRYIYARVCVHSWLLPPSSNNHPTRVQQKIKNIYTRIIYCRLVVWARVWSTPSSSSSCPLPSRLYYILYCVCVYVLCLCVYVCLWLWCSCGNNAGFE